jgi:O-antigen ligase
VVPVTAVGARRRWLDVELHPTDLLAPVAVSALLFAGYLKATPLLAWLPIDLTLLGAISVCVGIVFAQARLRGRLPAGVIPVLLLWATFVPGWVLAESNPYAAQKTVRLFTLTLLSALGAVYLLNTPARRRIWCWLLLLVGTLAVGTAVVSPDAASHEIQRLAAQGSDTIEIGRAAGAALLILCVGGATRAIPRLIAIPGAVLFAWAAAQTGSRGPILAVVVSLAVVAVLKPGTAFQRGGRILAGAGVVALLSWATAKLAAGTFAWQRITGLFVSPTSDPSSITRLTLNRLAVEQIVRTPLGIGWGDLYNHIPEGASLSSGYFEYTHNAITEATLEGGWLAGGALIVFIVAALRRLTAGATTPLGTMLLAIAVYFVANAMVSGDLNGNRTKFAALAIAWTVSRLEMRGDADKPAEARVADLPHR